MTTIWTLTTDVDGITTTVHPTEESALQSLRANFDDEGECPEDGDIVEWLTETQGVVLYVEEHTVEPTPPIYTFADLSTAHLPQSEMDSITAAPPRVIEHEYGAWVNVTVIELDDEPDGAEWEDFPALHRVLAWCRERNVRWINFDADADAIEDLPTWKW